MSVAVVVAVLVAAGEAQSPTMISIQAATIEALGAGGSVVVREVGTVSDGEALRLEEQLRAAAVVEVFWSHTTKANARIRIHMASADRWIDRQMTFLPGDSVPERGRTIGFAIASMLLSQTDALSSPGLLPPSPSPSPSPSSLPPSPSSSSLPLSPSAPPASSAPTVVPQPRAPKPAPSPAGDFASTDAPTRQPPQAAHAIDVSALGSTGWGGPAGGLGVVARFEAAIGGDLWLRAGAGIRSGAVPGLNGRDTVTSGAVGIAWRPNPTTAASPIGVGIRLDVGILFHDLSHQALDGSSIHKGRLIPGAMLSAEAAWRVSGSVDAIVAFGSEIAFGVTDVLVAGHPVATIPAFRGLAELGARFRF